MNYLSVSVFMIFLILIYLDRLSSHRTVRKEILKLNKIQDKIRSEKFNIKCSTFTIGRKNLGFHYRNADLYFSEDAFIIVGYYYLFSKKIYRSFLILTTHPDYYKAIFNQADEVTVPKQLNMNSSNGEVYIEFGQASFTSTNVSIRLKNLSEDEKKLIRI